MKNFIRAAGRSRKVPHEIKRAFDLINSHLYSVEERIRAQARTFDPAVEGYVAYACESSGKRLRPALALLAGGATGSISGNHLDIAVVIELIHAATLVHDDIMDGAETRRNQPTANAKWGNSLSVLLGDCLFAHALKLASAFSNNEITRRIATAASDVCSGEIIQTQRRFDLKLSVADYYRIIEMKTAALFGCAAELGAFFNEPAPEVISAMKTFGLRLGSAYQVYDDCVDIAGDEGEVGKTLGSDLQKGKLTLPLLLLLQKSSGSLRAEFSEAILRGEQSDVDALHRAAVERGCFQGAVGEGRRLLSEATAELEILPANRFSEGLRQICSSLDSMMRQFA